MSLGSSALYKNKIATSHISQSFCTITSDNDDKTKEIRKKKHFPMTTTIASNKTTLFCLFVRNRNTKLITPFIVCVFFFLLVVIHKGGIRVIEQAFVSNINIVLVFGVDWLAVLCVEHHTYSVS